jgi:hypothetical protein
MAACGAPVEREGAHIDVDTVKDKVALIFTCVADTRGGGVDPADDTESGGDMDEID